MAASVSTVAPTDSVVAVPKLTTKARPAENAKPEGYIPAVKPMEVETAQDRAITMEEVQKAVETLDAAVDAANR